MREAMSWGQPAAPWQRRVIRSPSVAVKGWGWLE